jgi:hypothetical protein
VTASDFLHAASAVPVLSLLDVHQPDVGLVHQRRRLERLVRFLLGHLLRSQFPQFVIHQRQQLLCGHGVAHFDLAEDACDVARGPARLRETARGSL